MTVLIERHRRDHLGGDAGITIVEILAAMIVLGLGILAMAPLMVVSIQGTEYSRDVSQIVAEAQLRIERVIAADSITTVPYVVIDTAQGGYFLVTRAVDNTIDTLIPDGVYFTTVDVSWTDEANISHTMNFGTYCVK